LKVFDLHPIHIALNTSRPETYQRYKAALDSGKPGEKIVSELAVDGEGPARMFQDLVRELTGRGRWIREIAGR
jgi:hypothetical protein